MNNRLKKMELLTLKEIHKGRRNKNCRGLSCCPLLRVKGVLCDLLQLTISCDSGGLKLQK